MALKNYSFRLDEGLIARIDASGVKRSAFVRSAVEAALGGAPVTAAVGEVAAKPEPAVVEKPAVEEPAPKKSFDNSGRKVVTGIPSREEDKEAVLAYAREHRASSRDISLAMGWRGLRYPNAERALLNEGRIAFVGSVMVCI